MPDEFANATGRAYEDDRNAVRKDGAVLQQISDLDEALQKAESCAEALMMRIGPVISPSEPEKAMEGRLAEIRVPGSAVTVGLTELTDRIHSLTDRLARTTSRVEL